MSINAVIGATEEWSVSMYNFTQINFEWDNACCRHYKACCNK